MRSSGQERISNLLDLYFSRISDGSISPELETSIRLWFGENSSVAEKYVALEEVFNKRVVYRDRPSGQAIESWIDTMRKLGLPIREPGSVEQYFVNKKHSANHRRNTFLRAVVSRVAAVMIPVLIAVGASLWYLNTPDMIVETVPAGVAMRRLQLPDGTGVWLRTGSRLEYPAKFSQRRKVNVSGDVFFDVANDGHSDFVVNADDVKIRVTGTTFDCSSHPGESTTVTLHEGQVEVKADDGWVDMHEGEQFSYDVATGKSTTRTVDINALDWRNGTLDFTGQTLREIFNQISKTYGITFELNAPLSGEYYMVSFFSREELSVVLSILKSVSGEFDFKITPEKVIINKPS